MPRVTITPEPNNEIRISCVQPVGVIVPTVYGEETVDYDIPFGITGEVNTLLNLTEDANFNSFAPVDVVTDEGEEKKIFCPVEFTIPAVTIRQCVFEWLSS